MTMMPVRGVVKNVTVNEFEDWDEEGLKNVKFGKELRERYFLFEEGWRNLNHGSFGTYPLPVQHIFHSLQRASESHPDKFIRYTYPTKLTSSRAALSTILNAPIQTLVFVPNATTGVNTVLHNIRFIPGDHILYFNGIYGACEKTVLYITETTPAEPVKVEFDFPIEDQEWIGRFRDAVKDVESKGGRVKIAVFDTVGSMPGVRAPFEALTEACRELGVLSLIDGAHGVGHVRLDLEKLGADFLVSNCHKWLHTPRSCAVLYIPLKHQHLIRTTLPTSHGFIPSPRPGEDKKLLSPLASTRVAEDTTKSAFTANFEWPGTIDNSPYLSVPAAIHFRTLIGGEDKIISYCTDLAKEAAIKTSAILGTEYLSNKSGSSMDCCMSNVRLPLDAAAIEAFAAEKGIDKAAVPAMVRDWICGVLVEEHKTYMAVLTFKGCWWVRWSAQVYLEIEDFVWGAQVLKGVCKRVERGEWVGEIGGKGAKL